jgi:hypothetical protein
MITVLVVGPRVRGFKPGRGDSVVSVIKIRITPSFGGEVNQEAQVVRFYSK